MIVLVILWTCVGVFIATSLITLLGLIGVIKLPKKYMNILFSALIVEIVGIGVGIFSGTINPNYLLKGARDTGEKYAYKKIQEEIKQVSYKIQMNIDNKNYDAATNDLRFVFNDILGNKISAVSDIFYLKGLLDERRKLWASAASNYETSLVIKPDNPLVLVRAARAKIKQKDYEEAKSLYETAQKIARNMGDRKLEYSISNGLQNVERRFGAFLLEVERVSSADKHFTSALRIIRTMEAIRPDSEGEANEKIARYRVYWEWQKYDEAISEVSALTATSNEPTYKEDLSAILIETNIYSNVEKAYNILKNLGNSPYVIASMAEAASVVENNIKLKNSLLNSLNQVIVADDPDNRDPYLYYVKALLHKSNSDHQRALDAIDEAIRIEKKRSANFYTFDAVRFEKYNRIKADWSAALGTSQPNKANSADAKSRAAD
jgi:tetratricopeptide (TPR) repeat protein